MDEEKEKINPSSQEFCKMVLHREQLPRLRSFRQIITFILIAYIFEKVRNCNEKLDADYQWGLRG